jgi:hypothetical protein
MESETYNPKSLKILALCFAITMLLTVSLAAQQHVISKKDNTRPETTRQYNSFNLTSFDVIQQNGYNEIHWQAPANNNGSRFFVEYSFDGVHFIGGEQVLSNNGLYNYRHLIRDTRPLLYRVRTENGNGSLSYSRAILPKGITIEPVQIQKNVVAGNVINVTAQFPVERLTIVSGTGLQVYAKDVNGLRDFIPVAIPSLDRGVYFISFYGNGWKSTSRFVVG